MPFQSPNFTQTPNDLFDNLMSEMGYAELKTCLALIRLTFGYQRGKVRVSLTKLEKMTGLSRESILTGTAALEAKGLIIKLSDGGVTEYLLSVEAPEMVGLPDQNGQVSRPIGQVSRLPSIKEKELNKDIKDNGGQAPPPEKDKSMPQLEPETPGSFRLFNLLGDELKARKRRAPTHFPSLASKAKFEATERQLGDLELEAAIQKALEKPILSISGIVRYTAAFKDIKYQSKRLSSTKQNPQPDYDADQAKAEARAIIAKARKETPQNG